MKISKNSDLPVFQVFECINSECRLRIPSDLSTHNLTACPFCGSAMEKCGQPYSNYHRPQKEASEAPIRLDLLLDNLRSSENVGSIIRSANGASVQHVYCCGTTPTPEHAKVRKSSLGAEELTSWSYHRNAFNLATELTESGCTLLSLEYTRTSYSLFEFKHPHVNNQHITLIVGNEISGIDTGLLSLCQRTLHIPMLGQKTSLNVAVAAAIAMYYILQPGD